MSRLLTILALVVCTATSFVVPVKGQNTDAVVTALKTIDPEILQYFPRWRVCEPDLQIQIKQTFALMGFDPANLDQTNIVVTSAPIREGLAEPEFDLILIECGRERMVAQEIAQNMRRLSVRLSDPKRPYCYIDIPPAEPPSAPQADEIINYLEPTNVTHAFTLSMFDQTLKIGKSGFWIKSSLGTDPVGYHYWSSGEGRVQLQRPLYTNSDPETRRAIPYLINARLGFGYRMTGAVDGGDRLLEFIPGRKLNAGTGGKLVGGIDFHLPMHPRVGVSLNMELPLQGINADNSIDPTSYYRYDPGTRIIFAPGYEDDVVGLAPLIRSTGQATVFYNMWVGSKGPENFFRVDVGINYIDVQEAAVFQNVVDSNNSSYYLGYDGITGLNLYHNVITEDWIYAKAEYRNQGSFPFGLSVQLSNRILLGRAYIPILGDWLLLEGKYSTPLRSVRPYEIKNFFMVSPVLRLNF